MSRKEGTDWGKMMFEGEKKAIETGVGMGKLNEDAKELLRRPIHGWATTVRSDGSLHNTVVWVDVDGDDVVFNTALGRVKDRNLRADPRVSVSVLDPENAFHLVSVSGTARLEEEGADEVIDRLAKKYLGVDTYPYRQPGEERVTVRVTPEQVVYSPGR
ncbi:PPOX class F420-dependent oxidoreductase [Streptosporangium sandarakinum]